ncbi:MAG TPA: hypothetical protein VGC97_00720 [Pyrinomonadaceae bacterium]|jgi:hypothetical protein
MSGKAKVIKEKVSDAKHAEQPTANKPVQTCPNKNWIELVYKYNSCRAVSGASYEVFDAATSQSLAAGCLDNMGFARVEGLPDNVRQVKFLFSSDPKPFEIYPGYKPKPHNLTAESTEVKQEDGTIVSVAKWVGGSLAGDFADDQSFGQIAFGTAVTMIPVVDQVGDIRDVIANLHRLIFRKQYNEFSPWFGLVLSLIGAIPELGSLIKGVVSALWKAIKNGAKKLPLGRLIKMLNSVGEGNVIRLLRDILEKIKGRGGSIAKKIREILDAIKSKLKKARIVAFGKAEKMIDEILESMREVYKKTPDMVRDIIGWIVTHLKNTIDEATDFVMRGVTRARNGARQLREKFFRKAIQSLEDVATRAGMKKAHVEQLIAHCTQKERMVVVRVSNADSLAHHAKLNHLPKPLDVKLKTAKGEGVAEELKGLVMKPKEPMEQWEKENIEALTKKGYYFDENNVLRDKSNNAFYGDYDVQSVHSRVKMKNEQTGEWEDTYVNEFTNPTDDVDVIEQMNKDVAGDLPESKRPFQHGAESDYRVKLDENGEVIKVDDNGVRVTEGGKPVLVKTDDMNAGGRAGGQMQAGEDYKLGRQYGKDEKYLVVTADGDYKIIENPEELKDLYKEIGVPWEYDSKLAIGPSTVTNAAKGAERAQREPATAR